MISLLGPCVLAVWRDSTFGSSSEMKRRIGSRGRLFGRVSERKANRNQRRRDEAQKPAQSENETRWDSPLLPARHPLLTWHKASTSQSSDPQLLQLLA